VPYLAIEKNPTNTRIKKEIVSMETNADGTFFQEGDRVKVKRTGAEGIVNATDGGVVYVVMDATHETKLFSAYIDEDAYIDFVLPVQAKA
jgi:hypothetical protein